MRPLDVTRAMIRLHRIHRMREAGYPISKECVIYSFDMYEAAAKKLIAAVGQETFNKLYDSIQRVHPY